ncbi:MAG TPA: hypothetical protein VGG39_00205 [Polyangiaceae bacterium]
MILVRPLLAVAAASVVYGVSGSPTAPAAPVILEPVTARLLPTGRPACGNVMMRGIPAGCDAPPADGPPSRP